MTASVSSAIRRKLLSPVRRKFFTSTSNCVAVRWIFCESESRALECLMITLVSRMRWYCQTDSMTIINTVTTAMPMALTSLLPRSVFMIGKRGLWIRQRSIVIYNKMLIPRARAVIMLR